MTVDRRSLIGASACFALASRFSPVVRAQSSSDLQYQAARAAVTLSRYEATAEYGRLYQEMHLDCRALVPAAAVVGWYRAAFTPRLPGVITEITDVRIVPWTWAGNARSYPQTAEVSFVQSFGIGGPVSDKVRLVRQNGRWRWFFGRDVEFINNQIALYAAAYPPIIADPDTAVVTDANIAPWGIPKLVSPALDPQFVVAALPSTFAGNVLRPTPITGSGSESPSYAAGATFYQYTGPYDPVIPSAAFGIYDLAPGVTTGEAIERIKADGVANTPADSVLIDGNDPASRVRFLLVEQYMNDAVGIVPFLYWGAAGARWLYAASALELAGLRILVQTMVANVRPATITRRADALPA